MTNEKIIQEIIRWVNADRPQVWFKVDDVWHPTSFPTWADDCEYIVNDKHAELRKKYYDNPDMDIQYEVKTNIWAECIPSWDIDREYREKPKKTWIDDASEAIPILCWVKDFEQKTIQCSTTYNR